MDLRPDRIHLRIEELVLDGFAPADRYAIGGAFERELTRLIAEGGLSNPRSIWHIDGGSFTADRGAKPDTIGAQIARSVYEGLSR